MRVVAIVFLFFVFVNDIIATIKVCDATVSSQVLYYCKNNVGEFEAILNVTVVPSSSPSGGNCPYSPPYKYQFSSGKTKNNVAASDTFHLKGGTYNITISMMGNNTFPGYTPCQPKVINVTIPSFEASIPNVQITNATCDVNDGAISINALDGFFLSTFCYSEHACMTTKFNWSNGSTTKNISSLAAGEYTVTISPGVRYRFTPTYYVHTEYCSYTLSFVVPSNCPPPDFCENCISSFSPIQNEKYILSAWVKEGTVYNANTLNYEQAQIELHFAGSATPVIGPFKAKGKIIEGWQKIEETFTVPPDATEITIKLINTATNATEVFYDDIRVHPFNSSFKSFVYDPVTLRLMAELDERNYATQYEYDLEGKLIRVKKETERGIETIKETRYNSVKNP